MDGTIFNSPSNAAKSMTGKSTNGKSFFLVDQTTRRSIKDVWLDYVESLGEEVVEDETDDDGDDEP